METNTKSLKREWIRFHFITLFIYGIFFYFQLKYKLLYLTPIVVILLIIRERKFRKGRRDLTWKELFSFFNKKSIS
jgi:hypothetical protein